MFHADQNSVAKQLALLNRSEASMDADDFRRIALSLEGAEEGSHMGKAEFRVAGRIFATLASEEQGYGNLILTPDGTAAAAGERYFQCA